MSRHRPLSRATERRYYGVVPAIVVPFPEGEEDSAKEGRVCLRFDWFDPRMVTGPCRVAQLYAGNGYGAMWRPEVGDEVLVGFVHGEMREPIVLGGLYNGLDKPFTHPDDSTDQKAFVTKGGHRIVFDDKAKSVTVATKSGTSITLDGDGKKVTISADAKITLKARDIELTADSDVGEVKIRGKTIRLN
jgi:phage baseplate assembly protein V